MKTYIASSVFAALVCATAPAFASVSDNLVNNGTFEQISGAAVSDFRTVYGGSNDIVGWTVGRSVDIVNGGFGAITGNSIDMLGADGPSSLSQKLSTVAGQSYKLTFDLSQNTGSDQTAAAKTLRVILGTPQDTLKSANFIADYVGKTTAAHQVVFTATSTATLLTFSSIVSGQSGAVLDNVSVAAVPEPESYAMLLAGLGLMATMTFRRRRQ